ncbi:protein phosphatase 1 regulatory subunit 36 isoform X2 [Spodoptera frugiperda]|uniref:Protein phosphatase 1 regulatory subunit 36 isoform X2 n=1 Tax=Spodoptera frugiperda TaxID=7108 RepID=A0A9R0CWG6_SPOFR|nr:protein phosphatase 1 regulatory subunit 36 isoform X2 [Spodoptera frugiperda]
MKTMREASEGCMRMDTGLGMSKHKDYYFDLPPAHVEAVQITSKAPTGTIEFRDDIDLIEQLRYKRRYQRKPTPGKVDLVTLQDVKDIALYTAPVSILSPMLIDLLHLPSTERFLRALIFCCAYYLQIAEEMSKRIADLANKVRTKQCEILENQFRENLSDLRILVAKEYCILLIGGGEMKKFHHMGKEKKRRSLSDKDARLFETFVRMSVQIVYLALGRRNFHQIELECHRVLKSEIFNTVEHTLKTGYHSKMIPEEKKVLMGACVHHVKKLNTRSPLMNEMFCRRPIDFRLMGLGVIKYTQLSTRLDFLHLVVSGPEEKLLESNMSVGLIGMPRSLFDIMLRPIVGQTTEKSKASVMSAKSIQRKSLQAPQRLYPEIILPPRDSIEMDLPSVFPDTSAEVRPVSQTQLRRWRNRFIRLTKPTSATVAAAAPVVPARAVSA